MRKLTLLAALLTSAAFAQTLPATRPSAADFPGPAAAATQPGKSLFIAWWNVENLFDTVDDPAVEGDEDFTPASSKKWDAPRLDRKLSRLGSILKKMNNNAGPDLFGVCEVENRAVLDRLVAELKPLGRDYQIIHEDSPSDRGIDVALLFDASKFKLLSHRFHKVGDLHTREIVEAQLATLQGDLPLTVFGNHWPSRGNPEEARLLAAKTLRTRLDELLTQDPAADIVILGDLNDYPDNDSVQKILRASAAHPAPSPEGKSEPLFDAMAEIRNAQGGEKRGTYVFDNQWNYLDHIILSPGLFDAKGLSFIESSAGEIKFKELIFTPSRPDMLERPSRTYSGDTYHEEGFSDHLPVGVLLRY